MANPDQETIAAALAEKERREKRAAELKAKRDAKSEALKDESKADAFKRIATSRVNNVLGAISTLQGLTNSNNYEFTQDQWTKIEAAINAELADVLKAAKGEVVSKAGFEI
jgi:hypothetical protein